jgi:hypothetical protein
LPGDQPPDKRLVDLALVGMHAALMIGGRVPAPAGG